MLKFLLIAFVVIWLLYSPFLKRQRQLKRDRREAPPAPDKTPRVENIVACAHCGVHLPISEALRDRADRPYCCNAHRDAGPRSR